MSAVSLKTQTAIVDAVLALAARNSFDSLTNAQIAKRSKTPLGSVKLLAKSHEGLMGLVVAETTRLVEKRCKTLAEDDSFFDRLFEIGMTRLEILQERRAGYLALAKAARATPALAKQLLRAEHKACEEALKLASKKGQAPLSFLFRVGFEGVIFLSLDAWRRQESPSIEPVMATYDRALRKLFRHFFDVPESE